MNENNLDNLRIIHSNSTTSKTFLGNVEDIFGYILTSFWYKYYSKHLPFEAKIPEALETSSEYFLIPLYNGNSEYALLNWHVYYFSRCGD